MLTKSCVSGKVISQEYILEYGRDCLEMHVGAVEAGERAIVVDDLIATGGTLGAAMDLLGEMIPCLAFDISCLTLWISFIKLMFLLFFRTCGSRGSRVCMCH
jgi:hypothetical protein